jgi:hypothetical protein
MKASEKLNELDERISVLERGSGNPRGNPRNPDPEPTPSVSAAVSAPTAPVTPTHGRTERSARKQVSELVGAFKDIQAALEEDDQEGAQDIVSDVLSDPDYVDSDDDD